MENFVHNIPTKLYFGKGQIKNLRGIIESFGKNVLLCYGGGSIKKIGLYDKVLEELDGFNIVELAGIEPNPRIESVLEGARLCKENNIDVVLAVGGGSTIDASKAICVARYYEGDDFFEEIREGRTYGKKALPLVDILTLSATGSEFDSGAVISNLATNEKIGAGFIFPTYSICDPEYTYSVSKYQTAAGSFDIISHICEGYFSRTMDVDLSDGICELVIKIVIKYLPIALENPNDYEARGNLMMASSIACSGVPEYGKLASGWPCHGMEHELSAFYDITHGVGLAILTPRWMRYILRKDSTTLERFVKFAKNVFGIYGDEDYEVALRGIDALENFFRASKIPMSLKELDIDETHFEEMAEHCNRNDRMIKSYVPLTKEDIVNIYRDCL